MRLVAWYEMQWGACKESQCVQEQERKSVGKPFSMMSPAGESFAAETLPVELKAEAIFESSAIEERFQRYINNCILCWYIPLNCLSLSVETRRQLLGGYSVQYGCISTSFCLWPQGSSISKGNPEAICPGP